MVRSGFCAIAGRPNVGKSTLLNAVIGERVTFATDVPQTTRHAVRGVLDADEAQVVFVDIPGVAKPRKLLGTRMNELARDHVGEADCVVFVTDAAAGIGRGDAFLAEVIADAATPVVAVANKIDRLAGAAQLPALQRLSELGQWDELVPVSARSGDGVDVVRRLVIERMPEGPRYFPDGQTSDQSLDQFVADCVRAHAISATREEVPHSIAVIVDELEHQDQEHDQEHDQDAEPDEPGLLWVAATVYVERSSQQGIVIGKGGSMLGSIGASARAELEELLGQRLHLDLRVKLMKDWQQDPKKLETLGY